MKDLVEPVREVSEEAKKYADCPECEEVAEQLISRFDLEDAKEAKIRFLMKMTDASAYLGKCSRTTGKWAYLTGYDFVIEIWFPWWERATRREREALLLHELLHIERKMTRSGKLRWSLRRHDVEEFTEVVRHYGGWTKNLQQLGKLLKVEKGDEGEEEAR